MRNINTRSSGYTLLELMIAVAIVTGLATIAIPTYRQFVLNSRTTECANEVAAIRLGLEEFFIANNNYGAGGTLDGPGGDISLETNYLPFYRASTKAAGRQPANETPSNCTYTVVINPNGTYTITANGINNLAEVPLVMTVTGP